MMKECIRTHLSSILSEGDHYQITDKNKNLHIYVLNKYHEILFYNDKSSFLCVFFTNLQWNNVQMNLSTFSRKTGTVSC